MTLSRNGNYMFRPLMKDRYQSISLETVSKGLVEDEIFQDH